MTFQDFCVIVDYRKRYLLIYLTRSSKYTGHKKPLGVSSQCQIEKGNTATIHTARILEMVKNGQNNVYIQITSTKRPSSFFSASAAAASDPDMLGVVVGASVTIEEALGSGGTTPRTSQPSAPTPTEPLRPYSSTHPRSVMEAAGIFLVELEAAVTVGPPLPGLLLFLGHRPHQVERRLGPVDEDAGRGHGAHLTGERRSVV